jgi:hypothetical protein
MFLSLMNCWRIGMLAMLCCVAQLVHAQAQTKPLREVEEKNL